MSFRRMQGCNVTWLRCLSESGFFCWRVQPQSCIHEKRPPTGGLFSLFVCGTLSCGLFHKRRGGHIQCGMSIAEIVLISFAVSMDAFAVAVCRGIVCGGAVPRESGRVALWFGAFQTLMPLAGLSLMLSCRRVASVASVTPYIAAALLIGIGGNMLAEVGRHTTTPAASPALGAGEMCLLALATSIDAFASGAAMGCTALTRAILPTALTMGGVTAAVCWLGVRLGYRLGARIGHWGEGIGGTVLLLLGVKTLLSAWLGIGGA